MNPQPRWCSVGWAKRSGCLGGGFCRLGIRRTKNWRSAPIDWRRLMGPLRLAHPTRPALREGRTAMEYLGTLNKVNRAR